MAKVMIAQSAWQIICREVSFFAAQNKEAIIYPLFGFIRKESCLKAPWEMLELADVEYFIVTHAFAPPRDLCNHQNARAGFSFLSEDDARRWRQELDSWSLPLCRKYPTLEIGNAHSHQFAFFSTWPSSGGDNTDYPRIYRFWQHLTSRKLNTPLEIIVCRQLMFTKRWKACCFGFNESQKIIPLEKTEIISDGNPLVSEVLSIPFEMTADGKAWKSEQLLQSPEIESVDKFFFGWTSCKIKLPDGKYLFVNLPPSFPNCDCVLFQTLDVKAKKWNGMNSFRIDGLKFQLAEIIELAKREEINP